MCLAGCVAGRSCSHAARIGSRSLCSRRSSSLAFFRNMVVPVGSSLMEVMVDRTVAGSAFCRAICRTSVCTVESRCSRKSCFGLDNGGNAVPLGWAPAAARSQYPTCGFGPAWKVFDGCTGGFPPTVLPCTLLVPVTVFGCVSRAIGDSTEVCGSGLGRLGNSGLVGAELSRTPDPPWWSCFVKGV